LAQLAPHRVWPAEQFWHWPLVQIWLAPQALLHPPQWEKSVLVLTHWPPQVFQMPAGLPAGGVQEGYSQFPETQDLPAGQEMHAAPPVPQ
jgi:hypothetical protein